MAIPTGSVKLNAAWSHLATIISTASPKMMAELERATVVNAAVVQKTVRQVIRAGGYEPNSPLTRFIKGSSKPLIGRDAQLWKAITTKVLGPFTAEIGVLKGDATANIAIIVHEGTTIKVTPKMRRMFQLLANASRAAAGNKRSKASPIAPVAALQGRARELWEMRPGRGWKALKTSTTHITLPPRPYIAKVMDDPTLQEVVQKNWLDAAANGLIGASAKLRTST